MSAPETLLRHLGIESAGDIDLETIAWHCGLSVRYVPLVGCDARIVGKGDSGILTVSTTQRPARQRFSLAHELGHWNLHRGRLTLCKAEEIGSADAEARGLELDADQYAAALLMPRYLFLPAAASLKGKTPWAMAESLAALFQTSLLATALRMIRLDVWPGWLVCNNKDGRVFAFRANGVDAFPRPQEIVDYRSKAFDIVHGNVSGVHLARGPGDMWFPGAHQRLAIEHCRGYPPDRVLTFVRLE